MNELVEAGRSTPPGPDAVDPHALPPHALVLVAGIAAAAVAQGAYHWPGQVLTGVALAAALGLALRHTPLTRADLVFGPVPALAALAGWAVLRGAVAGSPRNGIEFGGLLVAIAAVLLVCRRVPPRQRGLLLEALIAVGVIVAATAWLGVAFHLEPWGAPHKSLWRADAALTYANASAALMALLALAALARRVELPRSPLLAAGSSLLLVGLGATLSRGGVVAFAIGLVVLGWLLGPARTARAAAAPMFGAAVAFLGLLPSMPPGAQARPVFAALALILGLALAAPRTWVIPRAAAVTGVAAAVGLVVLLAPNGLTVPADAVLDRRGSGTSVSHRVEQAQAALRLVGERPLVGTAPGEATLRWQAEGGERFTGRYVHNEYLQVLAELGVVGGLGLLAVLALLARLIRRGRRWAGSAAAWAGVCAALVALSTQSAVDFLFHLPVVPLAGAALAGLLAAPPGDAGEGVPSIASSA